MYRLTKMALDRANTDIEALREEMDQLMKENRITKWVDRGSQDAKILLREQWGNFIWSGLVDRTVLRKYDPTFSTYLDKSEPELLTDIPKIEDIVKNELEELKFLGYSTKDISRLSSKIYR